jgi:hypothetical protein
MRRIQTGRRMKVGSKLVVFEFIAILIDSGRLS